MCAKNGLAEPCGTQAGLCCINLAEDGQLHLSQLTRGLGAFFNLQASGQKLEQLFLAKDVDALRQSAQSPGEVRLQLRLLSRTETSPSAIELLGCWQKQTFWAACTPCGEGAAERQSQLWDWYAGFRDLLQSSNQQAYEWDLATGALTEAGYQSRFWEELMRINPVTRLEADGLPSAENVYPGDVHAFRQLHASVLAGGAGGTLELRMRTGYGIYRWCRLTLRTLYDPSGTPRRAVGLLADIEYEKREQLALLRKVSRDGLTGLYNNETFSENLSAALLQYADRSCTLLLITVDRYNQLADQLGYTECRALLVHTANQLVRLCGKNALCGRILRDTFGVFLPGAGQRSGEKLAQKLCDELRQTPRSGLQSLTVTVSVGMSFAAKGEAKRAELIDQADRALAFARKSGGCAICYTAALAQQEGTGVQIGGHAAEDDRFDNDLLYTFFDRLYNGDDSDTAIRGVLQLAAEHYHLDRAYIWRTDEEDSSRCQLAAEWHTDRVHSLQDYSALADLSVVRGPGQDALFCCEEIGALSGDCQRFLRRRGVHAVLQLSLLEGDVCRAVVGFHVCRAGKLWTEEEKSTLTLTAKLLGGFLLRVSMPERLEGCDPLTGLQLWPQFREKAARRLAEPGGSWQLAVLEVHRFRDINQLFGTAVGDRLLARFARLVRSRLQEKELACRLTAASCALLLRARPNEPAAQRLSELLRAFEPVCRALIGTHGFRVAAGVAPADGQSVDVLLEQAKLACRDAKEKGIPRAFFTPQLRQQFQLRQAITAGQANALKKREFSLYIQPKYSLSDHTLTGAGAWVRWNNPIAGQLVNSQFLPVFRETGFVLDLDYEVLSQIAAALASWPANRRVPVSVRIDRLHFTMADFIPRLLQILEKHAVEPRFICLEVQEDAFTGDHFTQLDCLRQLKRQGFGLMLSGFGRGWSSLDVLTEGPFDVLRLDPSFFAAQAGSKRLVAQTVCQMAHQLGMRVTAEKVDTVQQETFLRQVGVDELQGDLFVPTLSAEQFAQLLSAPDTRVAMQEK